MSCASEADNVHACASDAGVESRRTRPQAQAAATAPTWHKTVAAKDAAAWGD
jgi:hypothetical protein